MSTMSDTPTKFLLTEDRIPTHWVNLLPDLPGEPLPPLHPGTMQPAGPPAPAPARRRGSTQPAAPPARPPTSPRAPIEKGASASHEVEIPEEVRDAYRLW